jgi:hypothetical protein
MLGDQSLQPHQAGVAEQVRSDLALLVGRKVNAIDPSRQEPGEVLLAQGQRQLAVVVPAARRRSQLRAITSGWCRQYPGSSSAITSRVKRPKPAGLVCHLSAFPESAASVPEANHWPG